MTKICLCVVENSKHLKKHNVYKYKKQYTLACILSTIFPKVKPTNKIRLRERSEPQSENRLLNKPGYYIEKSFLGVGLLREILASPVPF